MKLEMELNNLSRAELARKLGISRARVTQMLNLLRLPEERIEDVEGMGDHWGRRLVTERALRTRTGTFEIQLYCHHCYTEKVSLVFGLKVEVTAIDGS